MAHADRSGDPSLMLFLRTDNADALHASGEVEKAAALFLEAEQRQQQLQPEYPLLYALAGFQYCDLLQSQGRIFAMRDRALQTLEWARPQKQLLLIARDTLTLGRAHLALALQSLTSGSMIETPDDNARSALAELDEAIEGLHASGQNDEVPRGLLARAAFRRAIGDWKGAKRDLNEAKEIAEPALMRLYWCDSALEGARLGLAQLEVFAPLNGLVERSPTPPVLPDPDAAAALREEARKELDVARKLIAECGYHRRDEELAELDAVVSGARRFADLPPRV
jgi:tetratricopeptide (TPR) repeat protein